MSALPKFTMRDLLDAGIHFGHKSFRWNPLMKPYIFGVRNDVHIIDLQQTVPMLHKALSAVREVVAKNGRVLFVGTKRQASPIIADYAKKCGQYYVNHRWLGGMLTNWNTVSASIKTLQNLEKDLTDKEKTYSKKERIKMQRERDKLELSLGGIRDMGGLPDILFVIDTNKEKIAVEEATKLGIPIVAIVDSNSNPDRITYPIPGNDDAIRAISLYCKLVSDSVLQGIEESISKGKTDPGALEKGLREKLPANDFKKATKKKADPVKEVKKEEAPKTAEASKKSEDKKAEGKNDATAKKAAASKNKPADKKKTAAKSAAKKS